METHDYVKDALEHLSDNKKLFVSNSDYKKAAPNVSVFRIKGTPNFHYILPKSHYESTYRI